MRVPLKTIGGKLLAAALLTAAACSPQGSSSNGAEEAETTAGNAPVAEAAAALPASTAKPADTAPVAPPAASSAQNGERRCGWLVNPTPANWWLTDRDGQWILGTQGADQVPGMEEMPDMSSAGWVETNGNYGYGCACMTIAYDPATERVTRISNPEPKPLRQCQADRSLPAPD